MQFKSNLDLRLPVRTHAAAPGCSVRLSRGSQLPDCSASRLHAQRQERLDGCALLCLLRPGLLPPGAVQERSQLAGYIHIYRVCCKNDYLSLRQC